MQKIKLIKPNKNTHLFNKNQKCWYIYGTGTGAIRVYGKYRGKGRYIKAWLQPKDYDEIKEIAVDDKFGYKINNLTA